MRLRRYRRRSRENSFISPAPKTGHGIEGLIDVRAAQPRGYLHAVNGRGSSGLRIRVDERTSVGIESKGWRPFKGLALVIVIDKMDVCPRHGVRVGEIVVYQHA